jgi:hypothetical protein
MAFRATHSPGLTAIQGYGMGLETTLHVFSDTEYAVSLRTIRIRNTGEGERTIRIYHFADFLLGESDQAGELTCAFVTSPMTVMAENPDFPGTAFLALTDRNDTAVSTVLTKGGFWGLGCLSPWRWKKNLCLLPSREPWGLLRRYYI